MKDTSNKEAIKLLFKSKYDIDLKILPESKIEGEKTADFEFIKNKNRIFVAELKTLEKVFPSEETGYTKHELGKA